MAVSTDIQQKADSIRTAIKGKDVREALASSIEDIDIVAEDTKSRQDTVEADFTNIQDSEAMRQSNEQARQSDEEARQTNEVSRQSAENTRASNEETRQSNESTRQSNETTRQSVVNAMKVLENYDNSKTYYQFNKTVYQGSTYECIVESVIGVYPNADNTKWLCIAQKGQDGQGGDMFKTTYDTGGNGIVDNAEKLGGQSPSYYAKAEDLSTLNQQETDSTIYSTVKLSLDSNDIYTEVDLKRQDSTLIMKSVLSGGISPNYTTRTETYYATDGTTIIKTITYTLSYDVNGNASSEVIS